MTDWVLNGRARGAGAPAFFSSEELEGVRRFHEPRRTEPTPLRSLPALARELGIGGLLVKDESARSGLPAFKIAGAGYAIATLAARSPARLTNVAAATAGNHGRAVARAAREHGLGAHIYVPAGTSREHIRALRDEGAHVVITSVDYDATVKLMAEDAAEEGWTVVSDTAWEGYEEIPRLIMAGYTRIFDEIASQSSVLGPTSDVLFVIQAGVGSLSGAAAGWLNATFGERRPRLMVVEPAGSACVLASLRAGERTTLASCAPTAMAGLRCAEVSSLAWPVLRDTADAAIAVSEALAAEAIRRYAEPVAGDPAIDAGPSGAAGLAGLLALAHESDLAPVREALGFGRTTTVVLINTEAARP